MNNVNGHGARKWINILRWILFLPLAFIVQAIIVILLGFLSSIIGIKNQLFFDGVSAFIGSFFLVFYSGIFAPDRRIKVAEVVFIVFACIDIFGFIANLSGAYSFVGMETPNKIIPILSLLGGLYAVTIVPYYIVKGLTFDRLLGKIAGLGGVTTGIGISILVLGILIKVFTTNQKVLFIGIVILGIGITTWIYPYFHLILFKRKALKQLSQFESDLKQKKL